MVVLAERVTVIRPGVAPPELSILMPLYRREGYVASAVASVLAQRGVTAEVILSDDNSGDQTLDRALEVVAAYDGPHRVVVRCGKRRLRRDHLPLLVDMASCDVVLQAHDDDIAHPDRARTVLDVMARTGAVLVGSEATVIDELGAVIEEPAAALGEYHLLSVADVFDYPGTLIGARMAWRRSAFRPFARLDTSTASVSHDRLYALRAALVGPVAVACGPLLAYRRHTGNWSQYSSDARSPAAADFALSLTRLSLLRVIGRDVRRARQLGLISQTDEQAIASLLDEQWETWLEQLLIAHDRLAAAGRTPLWVDDEELTLANRGNLLHQLKARAGWSQQMTGPAGLIWRVARSGRRLRHRRGW